MIWKSFFTAGEVDEAEAKMLAHLSGGCPGWAIAAMEDENFLADFLETRNRILELYSASREERFDYAENAATRFAVDRKPVIAELKCWQSLTRDILFVQYGLEEKVINCDILKQLKTLAGLYDPIEIRNILVAVIHASTSCTEMSTRGWFWRLWCWLWNALVKYRLKYNDLGERYMPLIVGIRFRPVGKVYYFDPAGVELKDGDQVVVETARGQELGRVIGIPGEIPEEEVPEGLKPVLRLAADADIEQAREMKKKEAEAISECEQLVRQLKLPMKLLRAEYSLDGNLVTIFFGAEGRVDFRELVRELSRKLKGRVELRQVGPRDETRLLGGFGRCGRPRCCATFLADFSPVSIKMAKEQDLPLNPMKISGLCGRLLCCLGYEFEQYREMKKAMPREGEKVMLLAGKR
jgi:cell fate regulator YaaT (PSP1 superfamily)